MSKIQIIIVLLVFLQSPSYSKQIQKPFFTHQLKQSNGWLYIGKIVLAQGPTNIKIRTQKKQGQSKIQGSFITLQLISNQQWQNEKTNKCSNSHQNIFITNHELSFTNQITISQNTIQIKKQQLYYFVLKDCQNKLKQQYKNPYLLINIKLQIINNGNYLGQQQDHWYIIPLIILIGIWLIFSDKYFLYGKFQNDPDYAKMILFGSIACNISSLIWRTFGYIIYRNFGVNYILFHLIYLFMHSISQTLVLALLILISMGWSINFMNGTKFDISLPILTLLVIINIVLTLMTQLSNSQHDMYHTFDTLTGTLLILIRIIISLGFLISVCITYNQSRFRVKKFLVKFCFFGFFYICSIPIIVLFANMLIGVKNRNQFVFIFVELIKSLCNIALMYMISSSRSEYNKLSYKNASFLPNQTGLF